MNSCKKSIPGKWNKICRGPKGEKVFLYFRGGKEASMVNSMDKKVLMRLSLVVLGN